MADSENNELRMFYALHDRMMELADSGDEEPGAQADEIARELLTHAQLPLKIRIRACRVLACSSAPGYLEWARECVRVAQIAYDNAARKSTAERPVDGEAMLLEIAKEVLQEAEADFDRLGGYGEGDDEDEEGDDGGDEETASGSGEAAKVNDAEAAQADSAGKDRTSS